MTRVYTTFGSVRRGCGHRHRTAEAAGKCAARDQRHCKSQRGYSDRGMVVLVDGDSVDATDAECDLFLHFRRA